MRQRLAPDLLQRAYGGVGVEGCPGARTTEVVALHEWGQRLARQRPLDGLAQYALHLEPVSLSTMMSVSVVNVSFSPSTKGSNTAVAPTG